MDSDEWWHVGYPNTCTAEVRHDSSGLSPCVNVTCIFVFVYGYYIVVDEFLIYITHVYTRTPLTGSGDSL